MTFDMQQTARLTLATTRHLPVLIFRAWKKRLERRLSLPSSHRHSTVKQTTYSFCWLAVVLCVNISLVGQDSVPDSPRTATEAFTNPVAAPSDVAEVIQEWSFGHVQDQNSDGWPDAWQRRSGRTYPLFVKGEIHLRQPDFEPQIDEARRVLTQLYVGYQTGRSPFSVYAESVPSPVATFIESTVADPCFTVSMNTGNFEAFAPSFPVDPAFTYAFDFQAKSKDLDLYDGRLVCEFLDSQRNIVLARDSGRCETLGQWRTYRLGPFDLDDTKIQAARISISVTEKHPSALHGEFSVDRIRVWKMPKLEVELNSQTHIFQQKDAIELNCTASGLVGATSQVTMAVEDAFGNVRFRMQTDLNRMNGPSDGDDRWTGNATALLPFKEPGFFRVRCELGEKESVSHFARTVPIVILPESSYGNPVDSNGRFGFSLPSQFLVPDVVEHATALRSICELCNVTGLKFPAWYDPAESESAIALSEFADQLKRNGVQPVGVFAVSPSSQEEKWGSLPPDHLALLNRSETWPEILQPVLSNLGLAVTHFQFGDDTDDRFTENFDLYETLQELREQIKIYAPESSLVVGWNGMTDSVAKDIPVDALQLIFEPALNAREIADVAKRKDVGSIRRPQWLTLELPSSLLPIDARVRELYGTLSSARQSGFSKCWFTNAFDDQSGLFDKELHPNDLFLPFRTFQAIISNSIELGSFRLPSDSQNRYFQTGDSGTLLIWNNSNTETWEQFYFGRDIRVFDAWGNEIAVETVSTKYGPEQRIPVSGMPVFVTGLETRVARWRLGFQLITPEIESIVGENTPLEFAIRNETNESATGTITLNAPDLLQNELATAPLQVDARSGNRSQLNLLLRSDASSVQIPIRFQLRLNADREYKFGVIRDLQIGLKDIRFDAQLLKLNDDVLRIDLRIENLATQPIGFDCMLLMANRPRERTQISNLKSTASRTFFLSQARQLAGTSVWLNCKEVGTNRVLNHIINVPILDDWEQIRMADGE